MTVKRRRDPARGRACPLLRRLGTPHFQGLARHGATSVCTAAAVLMTAPAMVLPFH
jgi:hypothetical protein